MRAPFPLTDRLARALPFHAYVNRCTAAPQALPATLEWAYRRPLILAELLESRADVICLQVSPTAVH